MTNKRTPSTTWKWEMRRVIRRPEGTGTQSSEASLRGLSPKRRDAPVHMQWRYLGGGEAWIEIKVRGRTIKRPGHEALYDLLKEVTRLE